MNLELRIPPPLVALICAVLIWALNRLFTQFDYDFTGQRSIAIFLLAVGLTIDTLALLKFRQQKTTINPMKPNESTDLVITGVYKFSRNPMYLGLLIILCAWTLYVGNLISIVVLPIFIFYITKFQVLPEEAIMLKKFDQSYVEYKQKVRRWI